MFILYRLGFCDLQMPVSIWGNWEYETINQFFSHKIHTNLKDKMFLFYNKQICFDATLIPRLCILSLLKHSFQITGHIGS